MNRPNEANDRRWAILTVLGVAQLMIVLDVTIVNVALPSAQDDLGFSDSSRQWVITAYALAFGSLLLLGGKLGDMFGRRRTVIAGLSGFALASVVGGLAPSFGVLVLARALQGAFGALLAPSALSILTRTFAGSPDRSKAFGIFGGIAGAGGAVGLLLGGVLTEYLSWRWCMYVNIAFAIPAVIGTLIFIAPDTARAKVRIDIAGTLCVSVGLFALVFGLANAETDSWSAPLTILSLAVALVLLVSFVFVEHRALEPLLPLTVVTDRLRGTAFLTLGVMYAAVFAVFLLLTYYIQYTLGFSPLETGFAFLPLSIFASATATIVNTKLLTKLGSGPIMSSGLVVLAAGLFYLSFADVNSHYATAVLPALAAIGMGIGLVAGPGFATGTLGVEAASIGVAAAMITVSQQIGGSIGTALFSTIALSATDGYSDGPPTPQSAVSAATHGYTTVFLTAAIMVAVASVLAAWSFRGTSTEHRDALA